MPRYIGKEMSRVDGVAKVTGKAKYAAEFRCPTRLRLHRAGDRRQGNDQGDRHARGRARAWRDPRLHAPEHAEARAEGLHGKAPPRGAQEEQDKSFRALQSDRDLLQRTARGARRRRDLRAGALRGTARQSLRTTRRST